MATSGNSSTIRRQKAIVALLNHHDVAEAAAAAGLGARTLYRWLREDPEFQAELRAAESEAVSGAVRRLTGMAGDALSVLTCIMLDTNSPSGVRLRASIAVLDHLVRLRELVEQEERILELEKALDSLALGNRA